EYDDVMNIQRNLIYRQRREVLEGHDLHPYYQRIIPATMETILADFISGSDSTSEWDLEALSTRIMDLFGPLPSLESFLRKREPESGLLLQDLLIQDALERLEARAMELGSMETLGVAERVILLQAVDSHWMDHIDLMDDLRDSIGMRGYAQHDPVVEYKREGFEMFEAMNEAIQMDAVRMIMRARLTGEEKQTSRHEPKRF
ncbi:preprotein translocase subunit SecA, partial [Candidatus Saccharibacteria bacterium]|nr:preprotein translocase subunit SecA [Candidatus Saccharibacteria bacterium]